MNNILIKFICLFLLVKKIILQEIIYQSSCEKVNNPTKPEDCYGKSCEFIEEICCFLESINTNSDLNNSFNQTKYECVDFAKSDYDREKQYKIAIEQIKNGTYWPEYNKTYVDIISLKCKCNYICPFAILLFLLLLLY